MKIIVVLMAVVFMAGMAIWLFLFKNCYEMIQDIRSGTRKVPVIRKQSTSMMTAVSWRLR